MSTSIWKLRWLNKVLFGLCLLPLIYLVYRWQTNGLGINPIERSAHYTGDWTLRFLILTLAITPLRKIRALTPIVKFRRQLGLWTFFYGCVHAYNYFGLDVQWNLQIIKEDLTVRRFFIIGAMALALMVPLAVTSNNAAIRWMGGQRWQLLHRLVYVSAILGAIHYLWQAKTFVQTPLIYAAVIAILLLSRIVLKFV